MTRSRMLSHSVTQRSSRSSGCLRRFSPRGISAMIGRCAALATLGCMTAVDIRRASERGTSTTEWLDSKHSFSFAGYYDPANTHHGLLLVNNDDWVAPAAGFDTHPHRDMEIVTWVLQGALE